MQAPMKLKKWALAAAALVIGLGAGATHHAAHADAPIDCSGLQEWNVNHSYKNGDFMWYRKNGSTFKYQCVKDNCFTPGGPMSKDAWKEIGLCTKGPN